MSDSPQIELPGQPSPPRLSDETVAYEMGLLQDARWCEANPAHAAALRASLTSALAATGQDHCAYLRLLREPRQAILQFRNHGLIKGVVALRPVQPHRAAVARMLELQRFV